MAQKVYVVSFGSIIAGVYSDREKVSKRAKDVGNARIQELELDKDIEEVKRTSSETINEKEAKKEMLSQMREFEATFQKIKDELEKDTK